MDRWATERSIKSWWTGMSRLDITHGKARATLTMLVTWIIWNERNFRVFRKWSTHPFYILKLIKDEAKLCWIDHNKSARVPGCSSVYGGDASVMHFLNASRALLHATASGDGSGP